MQLLWQSLKAVGKMSTRDSSVLLGHANNYIERSVIISLCLLLGTQGHSRVKAS